MRPRETGQVMDRSVARTVKSQVAQRAAEILAGHDPAAAARYGGITLRGAHAAGPVTAGIAVGLTGPTEPGERDDLDGGGDPDDGDDPAAPDEPQGPATGGASGPGVAVRTHAAARRASASVRAQLAGVAGVAGVGLARQDDGYQVVINVTDASVASRLPDRVRAEARVRVTGTAHALGIGEASVV